MENIFLGEPPANIKQWIIDHATSDEPTAPNGKVLYKTSADGEWLESNADISDGAFNGFNEKSSAIAVIIPSKDASGNDVTSIGAYAFRECTSLISMMIPDSVKSIGSLAFSYCYNLNNIIIPSDCILYSGAFRDCSSMSTITFKNKTMA